MGSPVSECERNGRAGSSGADFAGVPEDPSFFAVARALGCIIRLCSAALSRWLLVQCRLSMTARDRRGRRRSPLRPGPNWCRWPAARRRNWAIGSNCGRLGCWLAILKTIPRPEPEIRQAGLVRNTKSAKSDTFRVARLIRRTPTRALELPHRMGSRRSNVQVRRCARKLRCSATSRRVKIGKGALTSFISEYNSQAFSPSAAPHVSA
jgi:hypothetical protein